MAITSGFVQLPDDATNTGKKEDHVVLAGGNYREVVAIGDPDAAGVAKVAPVSATLGLAVDAKSLPPGASTDTKQDTGNTSLAAINTNAGAVADAAVTGDNDGTLSAKIRGINTILADVWTSASHFLKVSIQNATIAVTQSGSWVLSAGSAIIGKVSIDQTTPGTTNGVQVNAALPAGSNVIGHVITDTGSTTAVTGTVTIAGAVTNAGTFPVQETGTWIQVDDAAFTPATSKIAMVGAEFDDASPDSVDEGDGGALRMSGRRELYTQIRDAAGNERGLNVSAAGSIGVTVASGGVASGAIASGAVASGAVASGAFASGSIVAGAIAAGPTSFVKLEDVGSADADAGVPALAVRKATPANTSGTDGDYEFLQMSAGRLWASATIDAALPAGSNVIGHVITDTGSTTVVTGTVTVGSHAVTIASGGVASGAIASGAVASGAVASGAFASGALASGSVAAGAVAAGATSFVKLEDVASADADAGVPAMAIRKATPANTSGTDGDYEMLQMSGGKLWTLAAGSVATNVAIADNPLNLGAQAVSSENAAVTTARQVQLVADLVGKLIVLPYSNPENFVSGAITTAMTGTTSTSLVAAPASGLRNYITQITVSNAHASQGTDIIIQDGSGGTTLYTIPAAANYGGATVTFPTPLRQPTTATAIFCANVTTGASTKVSASGYKGA